MSQLPTADALANAVSNVTLTMLGFTVSLAEHPPEALAWRTAALSIPGQHPISVALSSNQQGCAALGAAMFSCAPDQLDPSMIDDSLCELVNMTAGLIRSLMSLDQALGLPKVGAGSGPVEEHGWMKVVLSSGSAWLLLSLATRSI